ncbi:hypothetical protein [Streptomyces sp. NPDC093094]|uniref:hypothetical protein n=1 Tax=Streptomyces sp. NPDC093094 TaxID=3366026 RepID=UPI003817BBEC
MATVQAAGHAETLGVGDCGIVDVRGEAIHERAPPLQRLLHGDAEEVLLAVEVVVEGATPDVGELGDLQEGASMRPFASSLWAAYTRALRVCALRRSIFVRSLPSWSVTHWKGTVPSICKQQALLRLAGTRWEA